MNSTNLDLASLILSVGLPLMAALAGLAYRLLLEHLPAAKRDALRALVGDIVTAVEQANANMAGPQKKQLAEQLLDELARARHLPLAPTQRDVLIESAVGALNLAQQSARMATASAAVMQNMPFVPSDADAEAATAERDTASAAISPSSQL